MLSKLNVQFFRLMGDVHENRILKTIYTSYNLLLILNKGHNRHLLIIRITCMDKSIILTMYITIGLKTISQIK
jgi:hypothetical protein